MLCGATFPFHHYQHPCLQKEGVYRESLLAATDRTKGGEGQIKLPTSTSTNTGWLESTTSKKDTQ